MSALAIAYQSGAGHAAGTAYSVDTSEVGDPGNCKVEAWSSWARSGDRSATVLPVCVVSAMPRLELGAELVEGRAGDETARTFAPRFKLGLVPTAIGSPGLAVTSGTIHRMDGGDHIGSVALLLSTLRLNENMRVNANLGWSQDRAADRNFTAYGLGFDWRFLGKYSVTVETFGQFNGQDLGWETKPRFQAGMRYRPVDAWSVDLIYGRNIAGDGGNWITVSSAYRFVAW